MAQAHKNPILEKTELKSNPKPGTRKHAAAAWIICLLFVTVFSPPTLGGSIEVATGDPNLDPGIESYLKGHYIRARQLLADRALDGHGPSQYFLGLTYLHGFATRLDRAHAYAWFAAGEANGHRPSRNMRRALHGRLSIGDLPRAHSLARRYVYQYSGIKLAPAPCFSVGANNLVRPCHRP